MDELLGRSLLDLLCAHHFLANLALGDSLGCHTILESQLLLLLQCP